MNGLSSLVMAMIGQAVAGAARPAGRKIFGIAILYGVVAILALATLAFLYVALDLLIAQQVGDLWAAVILAGVNLALIGVILVWRAIVRARRREAARHAKQESAEMALTVALARMADGMFRKGATGLTLGALLVGLVVGVFPEIFGKRRKPEDDE